jgi:hypothetical protein
MTNTISEFSQQFLPRFMLTKAPMDTAVHRAPGVHMAIKRVRRANGQTGVVRNLLQAKSRLGGI